MIINQLPSVLEICTYAFLYFFITAVFGNIFTHHHLVRISLSHWVRIFPFSETAPLLHFHSSPHSVSLSHWNALSENFPFSETALLLLVSIISSFDFQTSVSCRRRIIIIARAASPACKATPLPAETILSTMALMSALLVVNGVKDYCNHRWW